MTKGRHRYLYSKNLDKPKHETLLDEDYKLTKKLFDVNKNVVSKHVIKNERLGTETTYLTINK